MCWFFFLSNMLFKRREPVQVTTDPSVPPDNGRCQLVEIPVEMVENIFSKLSYKDALHIRQSSRMMYDFYDEFRGSMQGPELHVYVSIENGELVIRSRPESKFLAQRDIIPVEKREALFRNAKIELDLRPENEMFTLEHRQTIRETFRRSNVWSVQLLSTTLPLETMELVNMMNADKAMLKLDSYSETVEKVHNLKRLTVKHEMLPEQLESLLVNNSSLDYLTIKIPTVSMAFLRQCVHEWKYSKRKITNYNIFTPISEHVLDDDAVVIDWRMSLLSQVAGKERLRQITKKYDLEPGQDVALQLVTLIPY